MYGGVASEQDSTTTAIEATAGQVVLYAGQLITAFYSSSSGGKTASAADVFGTPLPYLVSRPDPWDKASPNHRWGPVLLGARTLQSKLGVSARVLDASGVPTPSGRIKSLTLRTASGATSVPASLVRTALGLRSTWISIGVLRLDRPKGTVESGATLNLGGIARNVLAPQLQSSSNGKTWTAVGPLPRAADGTFVETVSPTRTTSYRIEAGVSASQPASRVTSQVLLVRVSPRVRLGRPGD
jgi:SpoIID/LytB domain protein